MITREQVADLREGDIVRVTGWYGVMIEGPVSPGTRSLWLGQHCLLRDVDGSVGVWAKDDATLTVTSRAPRKFYVNHDRSEPVAGDVARDSSPDNFTNQTYRFDHGTASWRYTSNDLPKRCMPKRLRLLVDGETGEVVQ